MGSSKTLKNAFKKHPLQNRTNVQVKGGGGQRPFEQCSKKLHFFERVASLKAKSEKIRALRETFERKDSICIWIGSTCERNTWAICICIFTININALKQLTQGPNKIDFVVFLLLYRHASVYSNFPFKSICNFVGYHNYDYESWWMYDQN